MVPRDTPPGRIHLPPLPFAEDALEPVVSARTLSFHHGKHHKGYVEKLNQLIENTPFAAMSLEEIIAESRGRADTKKIFNNAAQVWNHNFYWRSLTPKPSAPVPELAAAINAQFGSIAALKNELKTAAVEQFGSGWAWLIAVDGILKVTTTANAETPLGTGAACLLTVDVWEHAYYLDYQNARKDHVEAVVEKLLDWHFASENFAASR